MFVRYVDKYVVLLVIKIVDDILLSGPDNYIEEFIHDSKSEFELCTVTYGPVTLQFYGLNIIQYYNFTCSINSDDKLSVFERHPIISIRRRQYDNQMNLIEKSSLMSLNARIRLISITASVLYSFNSSHLRQMLQQSTVSCLIHQEMRFEF